VSLEPQVAVLIAEDDPNHLELVRRALDQTGYGWPVHCVKDGEETIAYLAGTGRFGNREEFPLPNILLLDLKMPGRDGFEVLKWIEDQRIISLSLKEMRVVVLTASDEIRDVNRAYQLGAASFIVKPVDFSEFREMVASMLRYWTAMNVLGTVFAPKERLQRAALSRGPQAA
jgi:CheY-like chemotaxis protein